MKRCILFEKINLRHRRVIAGRLRACASEIMLESEYALPLYFLNAGGNLSIAASYAMRYLKILADDLTGAADTAAQCRQFGLPATIFLGIPKLPLPLGALAFTSDSRHLPAEAAARLARDTAASLPPMDGRWYKKIDSTLRGNVGSELDALLDLVRPPAAVVCPAFPAQNRGLCNGILTAPALESSAVHLPSLLREQSRHTVAALSLEQVRGGELAANMSQAVRAWENCTAEGPIVFAADALTDDDLDRVLQAQQEVLPEALLCGSAGLVGALVRHMGVENGSPALATGRLPAAGQSVLLVAGSGSDVAHRQIDCLLRSDDEAHHPAVSRMVVLPETGIGETAAFDPAQPIWLLQQPRPEPGAVLEGEEARQRADHLGRVGVAALARRPVDLLLLVGGDTAIGILKRLDVGRLSVELELLPGMPLCSAVINGRPMLVVLKPGHFGEDGTLVELLNRVGRLGNEVNRH